MSELKRTQLHEIHVAAGASMVDFGGWEMPVQYSTGIVAEHLYTRHFCSLFDVSHMGRLLIQGPERLAFLQHVLSSNVAGLDLNMAQYCILPDEDGGAVDDAYLYRFEEERLLLVVNAANTEKDLMHLRSVVKDYDCTITDITSRWASIAVQGPKSKDLLTTLSGGVQVTEPMKNALNTLTFEGHEVKVAKTGYTGEPLGYEVYCRSEDAAWLWNRLGELGARPAGLGARDTLRMEAGFPLYGHEMGVDPDGQRMPIFAVPLAKFAVSFAPQKGEFIGRKALERQFDAFRRIMNRDFSDCAALPRRILPIALLDRGVMRAGMAVYRGEKQVGWVTSGTMVPYYIAEGEGLETVITEETAKRAIGLCYVDSDVLTDDVVEVDIRGRRLKAVIPARHMSVGAPPYARPLLYRRPEDEVSQPADRAAKALELLHLAQDNHQWRQRQCAETDGQDTQGDDGKLRHASAVDLPAYHEPGDQHAQPHQRVKQPGVFEPVHFSVQGGIHGHHAIGEGGDHHVHRQRNAHAQHQTVQYLFRRFIHGLLNRAPGNADERCNARPGQAQEQGTPGNHVKAVLLVYLKADDGAQAHAQRHCHAEEAQAFPAADRGDDIYCHCRAGGGHASPDQALYEARQEKRQGGGGRSIP